MRRLLGLLVLLTSCVPVREGAQVPLSPSCSAVASDASTPYDEAFGKACHNCYEPQHAPSLAVAIERSAAIEIDFWDEELPFRPNDQASWYVRHHAFSGKENNCSPPGDLAACLSDVRAYSDAHPDHPPITVFLDKKQGWLFGGLPTDFDAYLARVLPREKLFTPADLQGSARSLREAVRGRGWPPLGALKGKIILAMTGGPRGHRNPTEHQYVKVLGDAALVFAAPDGVAASDVEGVPEGFDERTAGAVVFLNMKKGSEKLAPLMRSQRIVARLWGLEETDAAFRQALAGCVNFVGLYRIEETGFNAGQMRGRLQLVSAP